MVPITNASKKERKAIDIAKELAEKCKALSKGDPIGKFETLLRDVTNDEDDSLAQVIESAACELKYE